jgi:NAD+ kinase
MKVILVVKRTRYESADDAAWQLIHDGHPSVSGWEGAHKRHHETLETVGEVLKGVEVETVWNPYAAFGTEGAHLVVVVGGDGTFLAASRSVGSVPMLGVNSDPSSSRGFFCAATAETFDEELHRAMRGPTGATVQRMEVLVDGEVRSKRVLNEALVCHPHPAATSRFSVNFSASRPGTPLFVTDGWEQNMSSGVWVGPPAGTTGAMRSAGGDVLPIESSQLQFVSRETIDGRTRKIVTPGMVSLRVKTDVAAVYMDGPFRQADLRLGQEVDFRLSEEPLTVVGLDGRR